MSSIQHLEATQLGFLAPEFLEQAGLVCVVCRGSMINETVGVGGIKAQSHSQFSLTGRRDGVGEIPLWERGEGGCEPGNPLVKTPAQQRWERQVQVAVPVVPVEPLLLQGFEMVPAFCRKVANSADGVNETSEERQGKNERKKKRNKQKTHTMVLSYLRKEDCFLRKRASKVSSRVSLK